MAIHWTCPFCDRDATIRDGDWFETALDLGPDNASGAHVFLSTFIVCPNLECRKFTLTGSLFDAVWSPHTRRCTAQELIESWNLIPPSKAKPLPDYIPEAIVQDYEEACLICDLSPRASAVLSRRCLQGMIRNFWKENEYNLKLEIKKLEDVVDADTWKAIDGMREVGNIGAHPEQDINVIVDIEPEEAARLISVIEVLIQDWYIAREARNTTLDDMAQLAAEKKQEQNGALFDNEEDAAD